MLIKALRYVCLENIGKLDAFALIQISRKFITSKIKRFIFW